MMQEENMPNNVLSGAMAEERHKTAVATLSTLCVFYAVATCVIAASLREDVFQAGSPQKKADVSMILVLLILGFQFFFIAYVKVMYKYPRLNPDAYSAPIVCFFTITQCIFLSYISFDMNVTCEVQIFAVLFALTRTLPRVVAVPMVVFFTIITVYVRMKATYPGWMHEDVGSRYIMWISDLVDISSKVTGFVLIYVATHFGSSSRVMHRALLTDAMVKFCLEVSRLQLQSAADVLEDYDEWLEGHVVTSCQKVVNSLTNFKPYIPAHLLQVRTVASGSGGNGADSLISSHTPHSSNPMAMDEDDLSSLDTTITASTRSRKITASALRAVATQGSSNSGSTVIMMQEDLVVRDVEEFTPSDPSITPSVDDYFSAMTPVVAVITALHITTSEPTLVRDLDSLVADIEEAVLGFDGVLHHVHGHTFFISFGITASVSLPLSASKFVMNVDALIKQKHVNFRCCSATLMTPVFNYVAGTLHKHQLLLGPGVERLWSLLNVAKIHQGHMVTDAIIKHLHGIIRAYKVDVLISTDKYTPFPQVGPPAPNTPSSAAQGIRTTDVYILRRFEHSFSSRVSHKTAAPTNFERSGSVVMEQEWMYQLESNSSEDTSFVAVEEALAKAKHGNYEAAQSIINKISEAERASEPVIKAFCHQLLVCAGQKRASYSRCQGTECLEGSEKFTMTVKPPRKKGF